VFFRTFRAPEYRSEWVDSLGQYIVQVDIPAEPFAYGLREDVGAVTVTNDPAAGANGMFFDVSSVKGDVAAPMVLKSTSGIPAFGVLASRQHGTPSDLLFFAQSESCAAATDTTNPGGAADAAMSGTATTNYFRTSFATTAANDVRVSWTIADSTDAQKLARKGTYRIFAAVRRSGSASVIKIQSRYSNTFTGNQVSLPLTSARMLVDLGMVTFAGQAPTAPGRFGSTAPVVLSNPLDFWAQRDTGAETLDWDCFLLIPADDQMMLFSGGGFTSQDGLIDGENQMVYIYENGADPFAGTADLYHDGPNCAVAGGYPKLIPGQTNRFFFLSSDGPSGTTHVKTTTWVMTPSYWPRYLYVRPT
jgi:hypothetical protein